MKIYDVPCAIDDGGGPEEKWGREGGGGQNGVSNSKIYDKTNTT